MLFRQPLIECVINISEGRDIEKLNRISSVFKAYPRVNLLHMDVGADAHRSVLTIIGEKRQIPDAIFELFRVVCDLVDMQNHQGTHPRIGAVDVCPFIPYANCSMQECIDLAHHLGEKVWKQLKLPVLFYENAALRAEYRSLADCRRGEYEGISQRMKDENNYPDFGNKQLNKKSGISIIGARDFLIAYNINLDTVSIEIAKKIASAIREKQKKNGSNQKGLPCVKAIGWYIKEYGMTQVSTNIINYKVTSIFEVFNAVVKEAKKYGVQTKGSELIGMVPLAALIPSSDICLRSALIQESVERLGLGTLAPFIAKEKILEIKLEETLFYET